MESIKKCFDMNFEANTESFVVRPSPEHDIGPVSARYSCLHCRRRIMASYNQALTGLLRTKNDDNRL